LAAAKARGVKLGGTNQQSLANRDAALVRAEKLRPVLVELASMSARAASIELNRRDLYSERRDWVILGCCRLTTSR
jgi:hypothetical protein